jgi:hypothetical protein
MKRKIPSLCLYSNPPSSSLQPSAIPLSYPALNFKIYQKDKDIRKI